MDEKKKIKKKKKRKFIIFNILFNRLGNLIDEKNVLRFVGSLFGFDVK